MADRIRAITGRVDRGEPEPDDEEDADDGNEDQDDTKNQQPPVTPVDQAVLAGFPSLAVDAQYHYGHVYDTFALPMTNSNAFAPSQNFINHTAPLQNNAVIQNQNPLDQSFQSHGTIMQAPASFGQDPFQQVIPGTNAISGDPFMPGPVNHSFPLQPNNQSPFNQEELIHWIQIGSYTGDADLINYEAAGSSLIIAKLGSMRRFKISWLSDRTAFRHKMAKLHLFKARSIMVDIAQLASVQLDST